MRNQLLRDADWAGMAHSVEILVPLVDIELLRSAGRVDRKRCASSQTERLRDASALFTFSCPFACENRFWHSGSRMASEAYNA